MYNHAVVIMHGYHGSSVMMRSVERILKATDNFKTILNVDFYNGLFQFSESYYTTGTPLMKFLDNGEVSLQYTIVEHVLGQIKPYLEGIDQVHLLGYSMGGLVARSIAKLKMDLPPIASIVQLATPNNGTEVSGFRKSTLSEALNPTDQLDQMGRNSKFIAWLNRSPTGTNEIPHIGVMGEKNPGQIGGFDGLIEFRDMHMEGMKMIYLGGLSLQINHYNIVAWEIKNPAIELIRNTIVGFYNEMTK